MKKLCLFLFAISCAFQSCEPSEINNELQSSTIEDVKIEHLKTMDENAQRVAFNLLNDDEKYTFRMLFINDFIKNNTLSAEQMTLLDELKMNFKSNVYKKGDYAEYFKTIFINDWSSRALKVFSLEQLRSIASTGYKNNSINTGTQRMGECKCHAGGFFRCTKQVTTTVGFTNSVSVETVTVDCENIGCQTPGSINDDGHWEEDSVGCGWFWLERCDGSC